MSRFFLSTVAFALLAALVSADTPFWPSYAEQGRYLERNSDLIEHLVDHGLELADQNSPLDRAKACGAIATHLANAIEKAADDKDAFRTAELSQHLRLVLQKGIAANLSAARREIHPGSADEKKLFESSEQAAELIKLLDKQLKDASAREESRILERPLQPARKGCESVEKAIRDLNKP
jgi:hypothetical protein